MTHTFCYGISSNKFRNFSQKSKNKSRTGYFRYFWNFSISKKRFVGIFIKLITYFCTSPIWKAHSQSNKLGKKCKKSFLLLMKFKNTESAQLYKSMHIIKSMPWSASELVLERCAYQHIKHVENTPASYFNGFFRMFSRDFIQVGIVSAVKLAFRTIQN